MSFCHKSTLKSLIIDSLIYKADTLQSTLTSLRACTQLERFFADKLYQNLRDPYPRLQRNLLGIVEAYVLRKIEVYPTEAIAAALEECRDAVETWTD